MAGASALSVSILSKMRSNGALGCSLPKSAHGTSRTPFAAAGPMEEVMIRNRAFVVSFAVIQVLSSATLVAAAEFGTAEEAKAMLERAVAAVKEDKAKAL